jgi:hypothetical protein
MKSHRQKQRIIACAIAILILGTTSSAQTKRNNITEPTITATVGGRKYLVPPDSISEYTNGGLYISGVYYRKSNTFNTLAIQHGNHPPPCNSCYFITFGVHGPAASKRAMATRSLDKREAMDEHLDRFGYHVLNYKTNNTLLYFYNFSASRDMYFFCVKSTNNAHEGVCDDTFSLGDGNSVRFHFPYELRGSAPALESAISHVLGENQ